jgi:hypothetical protein
VFGLPFLTFALPAMLGGLALAGLPVIAHLMHRKPRVYLVFPTLRLLREAAATTSRMAKLRRWLLLLLRCLLVACVAAAFAQPIWRSAQAAAAGQAVAVVIVIDASASSQQEAGGVRFWHSMQASAERVLSSLQPGTDVANVVEATGRPRTLLPRLSTNLTTLSREVQQLQPGFERADLPQAVTLAAEQLSQHGGVKRLVILSDLQRSNWNDLALRSQAVLPTGTQITIVDAKSDPPPNVALSEPRVSPPQPLANQAVQLAVRVTNFASRERQARLSAVVDGKDLPPQTVVLKPGEDRDVVFAGQFPEPGTHAVEFFTSLDGFPPDDRASLVVTATDRLPVLIVSDDLPTDAGSGTFFLARALAPTSTPEDRFEVRQVIGRDLAAADVSHAGLIFVGYLGELDEPGAKRLLEFVQQGGSVVVFCGEGAVARHLETLETVARPTGILPWTVGSQRRLDAVDDALTISAGKWGTRLLREFDESSQFALARVRFQRPYTVAEVSPETEILLSYSDETPALGRRAVGTGQLLLANFSPSLISSDLGKHGVFVALMQMLSQELRPAAEIQAVSRVGEPLRFPSLVVPAGMARAEIVAPDQTVRPVVLPGAGEPLQAVLDRTVLPGLYELRGDGKALRHSAVRLDPRESDLSRTSPEEILARLQSTGTATLAGATADDWLPLADLHGRPLWPWCFAAAMGAFAMELLLLAMWRK